MLGQMGVGYVAKRERQPRSVVEPVAELYLRSKFYSASQVLAVAVGINADAETWGEDESATEKDIGEYTSDTVRSDVGR